MKATLVLVLLCCIPLILAMGCGGNQAIQSVHAAPAPPPVAFAPPHGPEEPCPSGCVTYESTKFIELRFGPTFNMAQDGFSTTLTTPRHVVSLDAWIGTSGGSQIETNSYLQIVYPDASFRQYLLQFDKHQDVVGDVQRLFPVDLKLPAGTQLIVYHSASECATANGCGYDTIWSLQSAE